MLRRKITDQLLAWKNTPGRKPLIIKGCRQCGKTFSVLEFARKNYKHTVYLNFFENPDYASVFSGSLEIDNIVMMLSALLGKDAVFEPGQTILILDEIQDCPEARTALKFFRIDGRYDVIGTGSLLGVKGYGKEPRSVPVGSETVLEMYPLDFEEFLWANDIAEPVIALLQRSLDSGSPVPEALHNRMRQLLLQYTVVGGMPDAVQTFVTSRQMDEVLRIQRDIVRSYEDDMVKYAEKKDKSRIKECFQSIPRQLAKENKKFKYSEVESKATARKYGDSVQWLRDANMAYMCYNTTTPILPLKAYEKENEFKLYMADTGLLMALFGFATKQALLNGNLKGFAKGGIYENFVAQTLVKNGYTLHYYKQGDSSELEFLIEKDGEVIPIEVKAGNNPTKSLDMFVRNFEPSTALKLTGGNVGISDKKLSMPHFLSMFI